tara:strand:+ start:673 stop:837 length:165 start_codon:yes stop_codon:yes gene_type:complete
MYKVELSKQEISHILLSCETLMEQLKDDSTFENPNTERFYELWDIRNKLNDLTK